MSYNKYEWHLGSFTYEMNYDPLSLQELGKIIFPAHMGINRDVILAESVRNSLVKYGFMNYAKYRLAESITGKQIATHYHLASFIFYTKAYLDAIAITINHTYCLGFTKGGIDLKHRDFLDKLNEINPDLANKIKEQKDWIDSVVFQRDEVIHRKSPLICYRSPPNQHGTGPKDTTVKMTVEPVSLFNSVNEEKKLKEKYGKVEQDIIPFCDNWISKADLMFQSVTEHLLIYYKQKYSTSET